MMDIWAPKAADIDPTTKALRLISELEIRVHELEERVRSLERQDEAHRAHRDRET